MFKSFALAVALATSLTTTLALPAVAQDHNRTERVQFARGASSTVLRGSIHGYDLVDYVLNARQGQTLDISMRTSSTAAYFNVTRQGSDTAMFVGSTSGDTFTGVLPANGDYVVRVYLMRSAARRGEHANYTLNVGIR